MAIDYRVRHEAVASKIGLYKHDQATRLAKTKELFAKRVHAVDIHCHSLFSDGVGTVEENHAVAKLAGLDFLFGTDHASLGQRGPLAQFPDASWGQEPGAGLQHLGLLNNQELFTPGCGNLAADFAAAKALAPFVWVPHPAGWYPDVWYSDEQTAALWTLGDAFAMEVMNGANKVVRAYDAFDAKAVELWDKLLHDGRRVTSVAGSDAHLPECLGSVWTGVFSEALEPAPIIAALDAGRCFASEAALLDFSCDGGPMGSTVAAGGKLRLSFRAADSAGLASVRIVSDGKTLKEWAARNKPLLEGELVVPAKRRGGYFRLESVSADDRRAFSTPIYVRP